MGGLREVRSSRHSLLRKARVGHRRISAMGARLFSHSLSRGLRAPLAEVEVLSLGLDARDASQVP